jgi:predicted RNA-binding protein YlxR (DUF448 family)
MVVRSSTATESAPAGPQGPIRSCIGCRQRAAAAELLRVVVAPDAIGEAQSGVSHPPEALPVVPDPRHRAPGRGAWLHRDPGCVELAQRRRAFARALRVPGPLDPTPVREYVEELTRSSTSGTPQELKSNGHSMKRQQ